MKEEKEKRDNRVRPQDAGSERELFRLTLNLNNRYKYPAASLILI